MNGVLFINFVPVTVFAIRIAQGHHFQPIEFVGAALVIGALIANNVVVRRATAPAQHGAKGTERVASRLTMRARLDFTSGVGDLRGGRIVVECRAVLTLQVS